MNVSIESRGSTRCYISCQTVPRGTKERTCAETSGGLLLRFWRLQRVFGSETPRFVTGLDQQETRLIAERRLTWLGNDNSRDHRAPRVADLEAKPSL